MKTRNKVAWILAVFFLMIIVLLPLNSCQEKQEIHFIPELSVHNYYEASDSFAFNCLFLYSGDLPDIELVSIEDNGTQMNWNGFSFDSCDEFDEVDGYKMGYAAINVSCPMDTSISKAVFSVNGEEKTVIFSIPNSAIKHTPNIL